MRNPKLCRSAIISVGTPSGHMECCRRQDRGGVWGMGLHNLVRIFFCDSLNMSPGIIPVGSIPGQLVLSNPPTPASRDIASFETHTDIASIQPAKRNAWFLIPAQKRCCFTDSTSGFLRHTGRNWRSIWGICLLVYMSEHATVLWLAAATRG